MFIILYFIGAILVYSAARSMVEAARLLPIEIIERDKNLKMASPLKFGLSILPFVVAYLLYEQYPRFAWQIIFVVLVIAAVESVLVYYAAIKKLKIGGYPPAYVVKMRRGYSLAGLGLVILMSSSVSVLFKWMQASPRIGRPTYVLVDSLRDWAALAAPNLQCGAVTWMFVMKVDHWALGCAVLLETVLAVVAAFGGPHGYLGMLPWLLQLPGALLIFFSPDTVNKVFLLVLTFLIQVAIWYAVIATVRALRRRRKKLNAS